MSKISITTRKTRLTTLGVSIVATAGLVASLAGGAAAESAGPIGFDSPYVAGQNIHSQQGWSNTGLYDANVVYTGLYGFGRALQISDSKTTGDFGIQTHSPGLSQPAGEATGFPHFEASFMIGTALPTEQSGLHMSVSPDEGLGARMSYLNFKDQTDGVHVFFDDVTASGTFSDTDIATLDRSSAHAIKFAIDFKPGPGNDVVKIFIDGVQKAVGTSWEDFYRGQGAVTPPAVTKLLFREAGTANTANAGNGFLIDNVTLKSAPNATPSTNDINKANGWAYVDVTPGPGTATLTFHTSRAFPSCFEYRTDGDTNQVLSNVNPNTLVTDGKYPYKCVSGATPTADVTVNANEYVEVRMVFGAEADERFDWTRFDVLPKPTPRGIERAVLAELQAQALLPMNGDTTKKINEAIKHLTKSVNSTAWLDDSHLATKDFDPVFNEEKATVGQLEDIKPTSGISATTLQGWMQSLATADRLLAEIACTDWCTLPSTSTGDKAKYNDELAKGDVDFGKGAGQYDAAIEHYKNAWKSIKP